MFCDFLALRLWDDVGVEVAGYAVDDACHRDLDDDAEDDHHDLHDDDGDDDGQLSYLQEADWRKPIPAEVASASPANINKDGNTMSTSCGSLIPG